MRVSFNWLKDYVQVHLTPEGLAEKLTMAGLEVTSLTRIDQDIILEIEVTPNRADCLSIIGIAREVAAVTGKELKLPKISSLRGQAHLSLPIQIQAKKQCLRYIGRVLENITVGPSPEWLSRRLEGMGMRPVNNIVDITNFCLLEFGQPLHTFDLDKLKGQRLIVRLALENEQIITIDGVKRQLQPEMLVIADKDSPQALAGIMGGKDSEVNESTKNILLESAYFDPTNIHHTSRKLGLATESSYRFERGVDLTGVYVGSLRAAGLIKKIAGEAKRAKTVMVGALIDKGIKKNRVNTVRLRYKEVGRILGVEIPATEIKEGLKRLKFSLARKSKAALVVNVPSFRADVSREIDLIEEIARLFGYNKVPLNLAKLTPKMPDAGKLELEAERAYYAIRQVLSSVGLNEIMTYSLISRQSLMKLGLPLENAIAIKNPLSYEQEILRPSLLAGMLTTLATNINRKNTNLKLFELSRIYQRMPQAAIAEQAALCIGISGNKGASWMHQPEGYSFFDLKGIVETLLDKLGVKNFRFSPGELPIFIKGHCAKLQVAEEDLGCLGQLKQEILERFGVSCPVYACELVLAKLLAQINQAQRFVPLAKFPAIERDISLIAQEEISSAEILSLISKIGAALVTKVTLFDQYFGEQIPPGFRGLSYSVEYRSPERTLNSEEVDVLHKQIRRALGEELKVQVR